MALWRREGEPLEINFSYMSRQESNSIILVLVVRKGGTNMSAINQQTKKMLNIWDLGIVLQTLEDISKGPFPASS